MRLYAKIIQNFCDINMFGYANGWIVRAGDPNTLYFQLVDLDQGGLRHLAGIGGSNQPYSVTVTFPSIDDSQVINAIAVQADANDSSIWKVSLASNQTPNSGNIQFAVAEGSSIRRFNILNGISVEFPTSDGSC